MLFNPAQFINMLGGMQSFNQKLNQFQQNFNQQYGQGADPSQMGLRTLRTAWQLLSMLLALRRILQSSMQWALVWMGNIPVDAVAAQ